MRIPGTIHHRAERHRPGSAGPEAAPLVLEHGDPEESQQNPVMREETQEGPGAPDPEGLDLILEKASKNHTLS